jgi:hypothetical protein
VSITITPSDVMIAPALLIHHEPSGCIQANTSSARTLMADSAGRSTLSVMLHVLRCGPLSLLANAGRINRQPAFDERAAPAAASIVR